MVETKDKHTIGKYTLIRLLGEGAYGNVFLASEKQTKQLVCVKICKGLNP